MTRIHATFDGNVLRPEESTVLEPNKRYLLTVEDAPATGQPTSSPYPLAVRASQAADLGVSDMAEHHHEYAHRR